MGLKCGRRVDWGPPLLTEASGRCDQREVPFLAPVLTSHGSTLGKQLSSLLVLSLGCPQARSPRLHLSFFPALAPDGQP